MSGGRAPTPLNDPIAAVSSPCHAPRSTDDKHRSKLPRPADPTADLQQTVLSAITDWQNELRDPVADPVHYSSDVPLCFAPEQDWQSLRHELLGEQKGDSCE